MSVAVVTANIGGHDHPHPFVPQTVPAEYSYFTDDRWPRVVGPWDVVPVPMQDDDPRLLAKRYRMPPFAEGLEHYDRVVWIDASTEVTSERFLAEALQFADSAPLATWAHPVRRCVYAEATMSLEESREKYEPVEKAIKAQVQGYADEGYPRWNGLYATGTLVWNMRDPRAEKLGHAWLEEIERTSVQDQLSLPVVAWRLSIPIVTFPFSQLEVPSHTGVVGNRWLRYHDHRRRT